jgi:O-antigen ligase
MALRRSLEMDERSYDEGSLATHSSFSMAYYLFGLPAAICHLLLIYAALRRIVQRLRKSGSPVYWQLFLGTYVCMIPWLLFEHGATSNPRGSMFFFFVTGLVLAAQTFEPRKHTCHGTNPGKRPVPVSLASAAAVGVRRLQ